MKTHVEHNNIGSDKTVVLIHGLASESSVWNITKKYLHFKNYNTLSLDLSGHGESSHKETYSFMGWVDEILDVLEGLDITPNIILGHSLGGLLGAGVANRLRNVEKMFLLDPLLHVPSPAMQFMVKKVMSRFREKDMDALKKMHPSWSNTMIAEELISFSKWDVKTLSALNSEQGWDIASDFLYNDNHPETIILKPKHSFLLPIKYSQDLEKYHDVDVVEIPKAGHSIHRDNPKEYTKLLDSFIDTAYRGGSD